MDSRNADTHVIHLRHQPHQQRSLVRIDRLLDVTAELIDEVDLSGLTTSAVAERASSSVGSVYRYFSNVRGLLRALAERNLERFLARVKQAATDALPIPLASAESIVDAFIAMHRTEPGFRRLGFGSHVDNRLLRGDRDNLRVVAEALARLFALAWERRITGFFVNFSG